MTEIHKKIDLRIGEISNKELTWEEAKKYAEAQGMRLPTRIELLAMVEQGVKLPKCCWTCEEYSATYAWTVYFDGSANSYNKSFAYYAVPVAALD